MKRTKLFSILGLAILSLAFLPVSVNAWINGSPMVSNLSFGVSQNDILYYQNISTGMNPMGMNENVVDSRRISIADVSSIGINYYVDEMIKDTNGESNWQLYEYRVENFGNSPFFNHQFITPLGLGDNLENVNQTAVLLDFAWNLNTSVGNINMVNSSDTEYHWVTLEGPRNSNMSEWETYNWIIDKDTGVVVHHSLTWNRDDYCLELMGWEPAVSSTLPNFPVPSTFGVYPGEYHTILEYNRMDGVYYGEPTVVAPNSAQDQWHADYPDWLERANDVWNTPLYLNGDWGVPGEWFNLNTFMNDDYYAFYPNGANNIDIYTYCQSGADVRLKWVNSSNGEIIQFVDEDGDNDGINHIYIHNNGNYAPIYVGVGVQDGYYNDIYSLKIMMDGNNGGQYWPDGPDQPEADNNDHNYFRHQEVKYVYHDPMTGDDVCVATVDVFRDPDMTDRVWGEPYVEVGRINQSDYSTAIGQRYYHADADFQILLSDVILFLQATDNLSSSYTAESDHDWISISGTTIEGDQLDFYVERMPGKGLSKIMRQVRGNDEMKGEHSEIVIDGPGVVDSNSLIGVSEGQSWEVLQQFDRWENEYNSHDDWMYSERGLGFIRFAITHIFQAEGNIMIVAGRMEQWTTQDPSNVRVKAFEPFLIFDPDDPLSFVNSAGKYEREGPPALLPIVSDWRNYETQLMPMLSEMMGGPGANINTHFTQNSVRFRIEFSYDSSDGEFHEYGRNEIYLEVDSFGRTIHLDINQNKNEWGSDEDGNWSFNRNEDSMYYMVDPSMPYMDPGSLTPIRNGDELIWSKMEYRENDSEQYRIEMEKGKIQNIILAADGSYLFLGERYGKSADDNEFHGDYWQLGDTTTNTMNYWILSALRPNDPWTWFDNRIIDASVSDLSIYQNDIVDMMNFGFGTNIFDSSDITFDGRSFSVTETMGSENFMFKYAVNDQGIVQDQFFGMQYSDGTWREWNRCILESAPAGFETGMVWTDENLPDPAEVPGYDDMDPDDDDEEGGLKNPFEGLNIPGYNIPLLLIIAFAGIAFTLRRKSVQK